LSSTQKEFFGLANYAANDAGFELAGQGEWLFPGKPQEIHHEETKSTKRE